MNWKKTISEIKKVSKQKAVIDFVDMAILQICLTKKCTMAEIEQVLRITPKARIQHIEKLLKKQLITVTRTGKKRITKIVEITQTGRNLFEILKE